MPGVIGAFRELDATVDAIEELKKQKHRRRHGLHADAAPRDRGRGRMPPTSPVRRFTLIGGLLGATFGYWIAIWTSDYWPLVVGGKPVARGCRTRSSASR